MSCGVLLMLFPLVFLLSGPGWRQSMASGLLGLGPKDRLGLGQDEGLGAWHRDVCGEGAVHPT